ncbi:MAG TPA: hypothetical protein DCY13_22970 [Verrucomicrobiales bacterium]|nr:hypothetical protein [Verrucomicrobiales bacterium]
MTATSDRTLEVLTNARVDKRGRLRYNHAHAAVANHAARSCGVSSGIDGVAGACFETFTGLQLMCLMFAGFKRIAPDQNVGMDLDGPFLDALRLFEQQRKKGD